MPISTYSINNDSFKESQQEMNEITCFSNVKVLLRLKPCISPQTIWSLSPDKKTISVSNDFATLYRKSQISYSFDEIFQNEPTQDIYESEIRYLVERAFHGVSGLVFAYGQTCSGKTYTMLGNDRSPGIIYLSLQTVFERMEKEMSDFSLSYSYIEIYNDKVIDLLKVDGEKEVRLVEDKTGTKLIHLTEAEGRSFNEVVDAVKDCEDARHTRETDYNERSSRSHSVFQVSISKQDCKNKLAYTSTITLIDLAGSERASAGIVSAEKRRETTFINKSLLALATVIGKLADSKQKHTHIPYRDSKLTRILQPILSSLSSNICIICNIRQEKESFEESHRTLIFGQTVNSLELKPIVNASKIDKTYEDRQEIQTLKRQVDFLKRELEERKKTEITSSNTDNSQCKETNSVINTLNDKSSSNSNMHKSENRTLLIDELKITRGILKKKETEIKTLQEQIKRLRDGSKIEECNDANIEQFGSVKLKSFKLELEQALYDYLH